MKCLRHLLRGASLTAALFVFQACYGTPVAPPAEPLEEEAETASVAEASEEMASVEEAASIDVATVTE